MNESKAEREREREGGEENIMGDQGEKRECFLTAANNTVTPPSGDVTGLTLLFPVCA